MDGRFVVTGCGRSGTKWMSRALTTAGIPCGHEVVFNAETNGEWPEDLRADSSWMAATRIESLDVPVVAMVRHPLRVVKSWVEIGFFTHDMDNPTHGPLKQAFPEVYYWATPQDRALDMWLSLTMAALSRAELVLRIDRMTPETFGRLLSWAGVDPDQADGVLGSVPACNHHEGSRALTRVVYATSWDAHDPTLVSRARDLADALGYRVEGF